MGKKRATKRIDRRAKGVSRADSGNKGSAGRARRAGEGADSDAATNNGRVDWLTVVGARQNNLRSLTVEIPLGRFVCVTGVSGSGKSSLVNDIIRETLAGDLNGATKVRPGLHDRIEGVEHLDKVIDIDQSPIGRTPRSNPATYIKVFDRIRALFAMLPDSKVRGYKPGRFSFNVQTGAAGGGRCEACEGNGSNKMDMDFLADIWVTCPVCNGRRFNRETLQIFYKGKNIADVLEMDVQQALDHFEHVPAIAAMLRTLHDTGLDYIKLGQSSTTLSGGEAQRIKLARELVKKSTGRTLYLLDEPTTGLHFDDIKRLLRVLHGFVDAGNTVIVIEHNLDVIKTADWIIDLGPEGGDAGGRIVAQGTPERVIRSKRSYTGEALREVLVSQADARSGARHPSPKRQRGVAQHLGKDSREDGCEKGFSHQRKEVFSHQSSQPVACARGSDKGQKNGVIQVMGARQHNLKNIDVELPRNKISVCSGPSGSGKSSLAIDTIYTEGQRRYVESLSAYARQFLSRLQPPHVDHIYGLSPAICIEQKNASKSPRSTVGTVTEIYDYMRILWGRIGIPNCPKCKTPVGTQTSEDIVDKLLSLGDGVKVVLLAPVAPTGQESYRQMLQRARANGFVRARIDGVVQSLDEHTTIDQKRRHQVELVVDRIVVRSTQRARITDSVEQALSMGNGVMIAQPLSENGSKNEFEKVNARRSRDREGAVDAVDPGPLPYGRRSERASHARSKKKHGSGDLRFSQHRSCAQCSRSFEELTPHHFSFNSRMGWCPACEGLGIQQGASPAAIVVHPTRSILDGAIAGWGSPQPESLLYALATAVAGAIGFSPETPWNQLSETHQLEFLHGTGDRWIEVNSPLKYATPSLSSSASRHATAATGGGRYMAQPSVAAPPYTNDGETNPSPKRKRGVFREGVGASGGQPVACAQGSDLHIADSRSTDLRNTGMRIKWRGFFPAINRATRTSWQYRKRLEDLVTDVPCGACSGGRLRPDAAAVRVGGKTIHEVCLQPLAACLTWFEKLRLSARERRVSGELLHEITSRLRFLVEVGLDYVSLHRTAATLSGGEAQRIQLASQIGTGLTGVLYVLDEPTIGLHPRDNARLIRAMRRLKKLGNTLVVVEHDREVIDSADHVLDFGPGAGEFGGRITAAASPKRIRSKRASLTGRYLSGKEAIPVPTNRRPVGNRPGAEPKALACAAPPESRASARAAPPSPRASACADPPEPKALAWAAPADTMAHDSNASSLPEVSEADAPRRLKPAARGEVEWLIVHGARAHNLKEIDVAFPLSRFTCVTGVSGSGKSTLVTEILYNALAARIHRARLVPGGHDRISGIDRIDKVVNVDQSPIGISPTSNPATYTGVFDSIRELYAKLPLSKVRGYGPGRFSFNRPGGRCEVCEGMGQRCIEMHFLPDVWVECEHCEGTRYVPQTLEVQYRGKSIADVLAMNVSAALELLKNVPRVRRMLETLDDVGLGYLQLGQAAPTLSGGEAQRVKLAAELGRPSTGKTLYILDEPTTGLHFDDLKKLLNVLHRLVDLGNTCICIEHNLDVIKTADWVIDLGPEAGEHGGTIVAEGPPGEIMRVKRSHTGAALKAVLDAGPHEVRAVHDRRRRKKAEGQALDPIDLGGNARMPWERNGRAWHTVDHLDRQGTPVEWDPALLLWLVETVERLGEFEPTDWNHRTRIEIKAKGNQPWFCHVLTGNKELLDVAIRVGARTFGAGGLAEMLPVKTLDERTDLPIYGRGKRVKLRRPTLGWQEVRLFLRDFQDIQKPAARRFLKLAVQAYFKKIAETQERPEQASPWTADGKQWHLSQRAIRRRSSIRWKPALLMAVIGRFKSVQSNLSVEWDHQTAVQLVVPGEDGFAGKIVTNLARGLRVELRAPSGVLTPTQVDCLGEEVKIKRHPAYDRVTFWLQTLANNDSKQLLEVWRLCRNGAGKEQLRSA